MNFWFKSLQNRMHLGQNVSEVLRITPRKHSEIKFHQNWLLNSIDVTFLYGKKKKRRVLMNYFQARPRAGGVSEEASERADAGQTRAEGTGALTQPSIFSSPEEQRGPQGRAEVGKAKLCPPRRARTGQPMPEVLSQTTRRAQGWNSPARREQRAMAALIQTSTDVNPSLLCAPKWICSAELKY